MSILLSLEKIYQLSTIISKKEENLIKGCQSRVWLHAKFENEKIAYFADSDAIITKGIIALLIRVMNHQNPKHIIETKLEFINNIGLTNHLSPTRANGLLEMVKQMKNYAYALSIKSNAN
jgi:cysteine desulfuration protein SufE